MNRLQKAQNQTQTDSKQTEQKNPIKNDEQMGNRVNNDDENAFTVYL